MENRAKKSGTRIAFRVDGSGAVGFGHASRCASLAEAFLRHISDPRIEFWSRDIPGLDSFLDRDGFGFNRIRMPEKCEKTVSEIRRFDPHILVLDPAEHIPDYAFKDWTKITREYAKEFVELAPVSLQIDDFARGRFDTTLLLNAGVVHEYLDYENQGGTEILSGPEYVLLRPEFACAHNTIREIARKVGKVLVVDCGHRFSRVVPRLMLALESILDSPDVMLVSRLYSSNPNRMNSTLDILCVPTIRDMAAAMLDADLVITCGGTILYELAACGAPAVSVPAVDHQEKIAERFEQLGTVLQLGFKPSFEHITDVLDTVINDYELRQSMMEKGRALVDGLGADRVVRKVLERLNMCDAGE